MKTLLLSIMLCTPAPALAPAETDCTIYTQTLPLSELQRCRTPSGRVALAQEALSAAGVPSLLPGTTLAIRCRFASGSGTTG